MIAKRLSVWAKAFNLKGEIIGDKMVVLGSPLEMLRLQRASAPFGVHWDENSVMKKRYNVFTAFNLPLPAIATFEGKRYL